jgi:hypothetical protein
MARRLLNQHSLPKATGFFEGDRFFEADPSRMRQRLGIWTANWRIWNFES